MKIGLIDVDGHHFPNLPLMKLSAWHKKQGDTVRWYDPFDGLTEEYDHVYMSKVFSFSPDYQYPIYAKNVTRGGAAGTASAWWTVKRCMTRAGIRICRMRSNIYILITHCIRKRQRTPHMVF